MQEISVQQLDEMLRGDAEVALLDLRSADEFAEAHILFAVNVPAGALAARISDLVPRRACPVVLCADNDAACAHAVNLLSPLGYANVAALAGGIAAWRSSGREIYNGTYILNNALALYTELHCGTPQRDASELEADRQAGRDLLVVDSRSFEEYHVAAVPGAIHVPLAEVGQVVPGLVRGEDTEIVVTCGGRARAVLGCQTLRDLGLRNPLSALYYGTTGWDLADLPLERGAGRTTVAPLSVSGHAAQMQAKRLGVRPIRPDTLMRLMGKTERTLFFIDVRGKAEYAAGHIEGARWIQGGQLVSVTEDFIATRNARVALIDEGGERAWITAAWMKRLGWRDIFIVEGGIDACRAAGMALVEGAAPIVPEETGGGGKLVSGNAADKATRHAASRRVIEAREALLDQVLRDGTVTFRH